MFSINISMLLGHYRLLGLWVSIRLGGNNNMRINQMWPTTPKIYKSGAYDNKTNDETKEIRFLCNWLISLFLFLQRLEW